MRKHLVILSLLALFCIGALGKTFFAYNGSKAISIDVSSVDSITYSMPENLIKFTTGNPTSVGDHSMTARFSVSCDLIMVNTSTARGVCYSKDNATPTTADKYVKAGVFATGPWMATIPNLLSGTKYYYRPYVRLGNVVFYGKVKSFTTSGEPEEPEKSLEPDFVDLGLSVDWAICNLGTDTPEGYGNYYRWSQVDPDDTYNYSGRYNYNNKDNLYSLRPEDDAATVALGESWRMPSEDEVIELVTKCSWIKTELKGVAGYTILGPSGNTIFIPNSGWKEGQGFYTAWREKGETMRIWTLYRHGEGTALALSATSVHDIKCIGTLDLSREFKMTIRPVRP